MQYDTDDDSVAQKKPINGELAYVDPQYKEQSLTEQRLVKIMEQCDELDGEIVVEPGGTKEEEEELYDSKEEDSLGGKDEAELGSMRRRRRVVDN